MTEPPFFVLLSFVIWSLYLFVLSPILGWRLRDTVVQALSTRQLLTPRKEQLGVILPILSMALIYYLNSNIVSYQDTHHSNFIWGLVIINAVLLISATKHSAFDT